MADLTVASVESRFPAGTTVTARLLSGFPLGWRASAGVPARATSRGTGVVQADGSLTISGLNEGESYRLTATVGGELRTLVAAASETGDEDFSVVRVRIAVRAGQSNQVGHGPVSDIDNTRRDVPDPRILQWGPLDSDGATSTVHYSGELTVAVDPIDQHGNSGYGLGPSGEWARRVLPTLPATDVIVLVGVAHGGTGMLPVTASTPSWLVEGTEGSPNLYENAITQTLAAQAAAEEMFPDALVEVGWIDWLQGESENANTADYEAQLLDVLNGWRDRLDAPNALINVSQMVPEYITGNRVLIDAIHQRIPTLLERASFSPAPAGYIYGDGSSHFSTQGYRLVGRSEAAAVPRAVSNVIGRPPVAPPSVDLVQQAGGKVEVTIGLPVCRYTEFEVGYRKGSSGAWTTVARAHPANYQEILTGIDLASHYQVRVATINELGTSDYTVAEIDMVDVPGQVTGLATGTAASTSIPLTWNAVAGATSYLVEYKKHADVGWTTFGTVTAEAETVTGLVPETSYDFRVSAQNVAGDGTASSTATVSTIALALLATEVGVTAARAYSVARKLVSGYAGSAIRVRRSSDNAETDIGFVNGVLDVATMMTYAGANSLYVKTVYDQSGNGKDLTQATAASQPRIVNLGVLESRLGQPAAIFDGNDDILVSATGAGAYAAGAASILRVDSTVGVANGRWFGSSTTGAQLAQYEIGFTSTPLPNLTIRNDANSPAILSTNLGLSLLNDQTVQTSLIDTGSQVTMRRDGVAGTPTAYTRSGAVTLTTLALGGMARSTNSAFVAGAFQEAAIFYAALTTPQLTAGEGNQKAFYGTA